MYSKLLVPLDGSPLSETILPYAKNVARALKLPVELLLAIEPLELKAKGSSDPEKTGRDYLNRLAASFPEPNSVTSTVEIGNPADLIIDTASEQTDSLIAMSTRGRSGIQRWLMGSVADKVLHAVSNPLLLFRGETESQRSGEAHLSKIIVPLDGSPLAEKAVPYVTELAKKMNLEVLVVRAPAAPQPATVEVEMDMAAYQDIAREIIKETASYLEAKVKEFQASGLKVSSMPLEGEAAGEIIDLARKTPDNLIAISTHGWTGFGRWVLGSVTARVVRHSGDPVLIIR